MTDDVQSVVCVAVTQARLLRRCQRQRDDAPGSHSREHIGEVERSVCRIIAEVVTLIGNLATEVEVKEVGQGKTVASFLLAVDRASKDGGADFVRISVWDRQAELCNQYLAKGARVALDGRLRSRSWEAPDGTRRSAVEVVANRVEFLTPAGSQPARGETPFEEAAMA